MEHKPHYLVTAGSTREKIDRVREWGNIFTGKTGLDIALSLLELGSVTLLTSNRAHAAEHDGYYGKKGMLGVETFETHAELRDLLAERMTGESAAVDGVFMSAAVSDYKPEGVFKVAERREEAGGRETWVVENVQAEKVKSHHGTIAVLGEATEKLIDLFRKSWGYKGLLVKFKLEVGISEEELVKVAEASRAASGADFIVANTLEMVAGTGIVSGVEAGAYVIGEGVCGGWGRGELAGRLRDLAVSRVGK